MTFPAGHTGTWRTITKLAYKTVGCKGVAGQVMEAASLIKAGIKLRELSVRF